MRDQGWTAPEWPTEYGGGGLSEEQAGILKEEMKSIGARAPLYSIGIWMLGPAILEYGTEEQKQKFVTAIVRGESRWCQGYSEPGFGSDLAGLQCKAEDHDLYCWGPLRFRLNWAKQYRSHSLRCWSRPS